MQIIQPIQNRIYTIRGERVMLDRDLADLYDIEIKVFNQAVKRNSKRFPSDFLFQLTKDEYENVSNSNVENKFPNHLRSQIVTLKTGRGQHRKYLPYAFTEQGVAMLSGEHDVQLNQIYDAIENLLDEKASQRNWDNRDRIGFK